MSSEIKANKISPATGTSFTIGDSGDTFTIPSGATIINSGTATGFGSVVLQCLQTKLTTPFTTSSTTMTNITGLSQAITPASGTKVLVTVVVNWSQATDGKRNYWQVLRDSTAIAIGDADGDRTRSAFNVFYSSQGNENSLNSVIHWLDTHGADGSTAVTYKLQGKCEAGTLCVNREGIDSDTANFGRFASTITLMEIGF